MQTTTVKLHSLRYADARTYLAAALFVAGNLALPQLCHAVHMGGPTWLPIYFFTLVGAYKYGWRVGLLTALASPLLNSVLFGMPLPAMLPAIVLKSLLLAGAAGFAAARFRRASLPLLAAVVLAYQVVGLAGRMGPHGLAARRRAGFPHRSARHVAPDLRRLGRHPPCNPQVVWPRNWDSAACACRSRRPEISPQ